MLPRLDRLSLKPTGGFWTLTPAEAAEEDEEPIHGYAFLPGQVKEDVAATFRVRNKDPLWGTTDEYFYHYFEAESLWTWVRRDGQAFNPKNREPLWKEDWWALHDRFAPDTPVPSWVRNLPQLDPSQPDNRAYAAAPAAPVVIPTWANDLNAAFNVTWNFANNSHGVYSAEEDAETMGVALRRITMRYVDDPTYRQRIETYEVVDDSIAGAHTTLMDVIEDALKFVERPGHGAPLRAKTAAIRFVAFFLHPTTFVRRVAELIYDLDGPIHQELRNALNLYLSDGTQRDPEVPALGHSANLRAARRVRHHTFWNKPISDREVSPRTPLPVAPRAHTPAEGAVMSELTQKVWEAVGFMAAFSHDQNDIKDFFSLEEHARHAAEPMVELATAALSRVEELFRQTTAFPADGRRRWNSTNLFVYALRVFGELAKWRAQDNGAFGDVWGEVLDTWAEKVASVVTMAVGHDDERYFSTEPSPEEVNLFFWWYVAPRYETGAVVDLLKVHTTDSDDREAAMVALDELNRWLPDALPEHARPEGEATPGRRRQRTEA